MDGQEHITGLEVFLGMGTTGPSEHSGLAKTGTGCTSHTGVASVGITFRGFIHRDI